MLGLPGRGCFGLVPKGVGAYWAAANMGSVGCAELAEGETVVLLG